MITPCSVWMSCCVGCMREKILRRLICMVSRLSGGRKNSTFSSSRSSAAKKARSCSFGAGADFSGMAKGSLRAACELEPFVGDDHHRLRQIERGKGRIDRQRDDAVGERDLVVFQPIALAAEQNGDGLAGGNARRHQRRRLRRPDDGLGLVVRPRRGGEDEAAIGDGGFERVVELGAVEDAAGAGRHHARFVIGPALPRLDQAQPRQAEIRHGAGGGADIFAKLRLDQDRRPGRAARSSPWSCRSLPRASLLRDAVTSRI